MKTLHYVALAYLAEHQGEYLEHDRSFLINRCIGHLSDAHAVSLREAEICTLQAYGDLKSRECKAYVDVSLSTSHTVFIRDPKNALLHAFTVAELIELVSLRSIPGAKSDAGIRCASQSPTL